VPFAVCAAVAFARNLAIFLTIVLVGAVDSTDTAGAPVLPPDVVAAVTARWRGAYHGMLRISTGKWRGPAKCCHGSNERSHSVIDDVF
jgi:hypothetical protein